MDPVSKNDPPVTVNMKLTHSDFELMYETATSWFGNQSFTDTNGEETLRFDEFCRSGEPAGEDWLFIYWFGACNAEMMLARSYLDARGYSYVVVWDKAEFQDDDDDMDDDGDPLGWAIVTDYGDTDMFDVRARNLALESEQEDLEAKFRSIVEGEGPFDIEI